MHRLLSTLSVSIISLLAGGMAIFSPARANASPLILAEGGATSYVIVISREAPAAVGQAADELAYFLNQITGADFPIQRDDGSTTAREIILGDTNRLAYADLSPHQKSDGWESFSLVRQEEKLFILGNMPRTTLYGVYDLLDVELGVRFLTSDAMHVPAQPNLIVDIASRHYAPVVEHRTIWEAKCSPAAIRNRMNGTGFQIPGEKLLGGLKWVGRPVHTFNTFVPTATYFKTNPEYFSLYEGERRDDPTQLCLTHPDVFRLTMEKVRGWTEGAADNPYSRYVVSVTPNDHDYHCQCDACEAHNRKAGAPVIGALIWFVNRVAAEIADERPNVIVETLAYAQYEEPPKGIKLHPNVMIRFAPIQLDYRRRLDDPNSPKNVRAYRNMAAWSKLCNNIYVWNYYTNFRDFMHPYPNLEVLDHNMRVKADLGMRGLFAQNQQSLNTEMQALRCYMLARLMWRPQLDGRTVMEEFCRLYYGEAAGRQVLRYLDFMHDEAERQNAILTIVGGFDAHRQFRETADDILEEAEARAATPLLKQRVATVRLSIWKTMLDRAFLETGRVVAFPQTWAFRLDPDGVGDAAGWHHPGTLDDWSSIETNRQWSKTGSLVTDNKIKTAWYATAFEMPETSTDHVAFHFGAVEGLTDVYLDGVKIGEQKFGGHTTRRLGFYLTVDKNLLTPGRHLLVVRSQKAVHHAGIWKPASVVDLTAPLSPRIRHAAERFIDTALAADLTFIDESYGGPYFQTEKIYFPMIKTFLKFR